LVFDLNGFFLVLGGFEAPLKPRKKNWLPDENEKSRVIFRLLKKSWQSMAKKSLEVKFRANFLRCPLYASSDGKKS
jgi:hypothetical protein